MKKVLIVLVVVVLVLVLSSCDISDGANTVYLPFEEGGATVFLAIKDNSWKNGIYMDVRNKQIYCEEPNAIIKLRDSMIGTVPSTIIFYLDAEYVCKLGQKAFDNDMSIILGELP